VTTLKVLRLWHGSAVQRGFLLLAESFLSLVITITTISILFLPFAQDRCLEAAGEAIRYPACIE
jgi:hypothetical protein